MTEIEEIYSHYENGQRYPKQIFEIIRNPKSSCKWCFNGNRTGNISDSPWTKYIGTLVDSTEIEALYYPSHADDEDTVYIYFNFGPMIHPDHKPNRLGTNHWSLCFCNLRIVEQKEFVENNYKENKKFARDIV